MVLLIMLVVGSCVILRLRRNTRKSGPYHSVSRGRGVRIASDTDMELDRLVDSMDAERETKAARSKPPKDEEEQFVVAQEEER